VTDLRPGITAVIAAHPARLRSGLLARALTSVCKQTLQPDAILVVNDKDQHGAGWTRRTILEQVNTTLFAWLDSDDYWYPTHLEKLNKLMQETGAKYVFSYFDAMNDPFRSAKDPQGHFGKTYDVCNPHHTTITALVDTALAKGIGYEDTELDGQFSSEDWKFIARFAEQCCRDGFRMEHLPERTWFWEQGSQNSSGKPGQGDA
jgi:glycosyltransferase involved in cell wall biosynthesis